MNPPEAASLVTRLHLSQICCSRGCQELLLLLLLLLLQHLLLLFFILLLLLLLLLVNSGRVGGGSDWLVRYLWMFAGGNSQNHVRVFSRCFQVCLEPWRFCVGPCGVRVNRTEEEASSSFLSCFSYFLFELRPSPAIAHD